MYGLPGIFIIIGGLAEFGLMFFLYKIIRAVNSPDAINPDIITEKSLYDKPSDKDNKNPFFMD